VIETVAWPRRSETTEDIERAVAAARAQGLADHLLGIQLNYSFYSFEILGSQAALDACREGLDSARRRGDQAAALEFRTGLIQRQYFSGEWDQALQEIEALERSLEEARATTDLCLVRAVQAAILAARGESGEVSTFAEWLAEQGRRSEYPWIAAYALTAGSTFHLQRGHPEVAAELIREVGSQHLREYVELAPTLVRTALDAGLPDLAAFLVEELAPLSPLCEHSQATCQALLAEARGEQEAASDGFADAAARWHDFGVPYEEAQALLGQGRCLLTLGKADEAGEPLTGAHEIFERLGAKPALTEVDDLLRHVDASAD
jgi:hypothetical protein